MTKKLADLTYIDEEGIIRTEHIYTPDGVMRFIHIDYKDKRYEISPEDILDSLHYSFTNTPIKIISDTETKDVLVDIMDVDGNRFRDTIKVSTELTIIKLDKEIEDD